MEDTLRAPSSNEMQENWVLILVLMEDTLRGFNKYGMWNIPSVLILVLMEDTLRGAEMRRNFNYHKS